MSSFHSQPSTAAGLAWPGKHSIRFVGIGLQGPEHLPQVEVLVLCLCLEAQSLSLGASQPALGF